jgi:hypothetical protein
MVIILVVVGVACCGLCAYGINKAIRRRKKRQLRDTSALTAR